ncbi:hypothetical protein A3K64_00125 [Candidatus Micrarchaeota archaeon RBG_16_36_9]|nr:MAG: hypothetical protein A3K64_00125 [Candidatus Micrarchaeota archaeon RBG_16_36_9]
MDCFYFITFLLTTHSLILEGIEKEICKPVKPVCIDDPKNCPFSDFCSAYKTKNFNVRPG